MWTSEYVEMGGYDCMTDAIEIKHDGRTVATIDRADYDNVKSWGDEPENPYMAADAEFIVNACNAYKGK